ncbi:MAG: glycosyltransferase family 4 protein [Bacteroidetes bacterium]|nr:glycosyltransferase family 4 protein [Bacteroidota bacterium]
MFVVQVSTVHPYNDNRIYEKIIKSSLYAGIEVMYITKKSDIKLELPQDVNDRLYNRFLPNGKSVFFKLLRFILVAYHITVLEKSKRNIHFHDPELIPIMLVIQFILKAKVIYDIHEENSLAIKMKFGGLKRKLFYTGILYFEEKAKKNFKCVIAENSYVERFPDAIPVLNYFNTKTVPIKVEIEELKNNGVYTDFIYVGSISVERGLLNYFNMIREVKQLRIFLVGICSEEIITMIRDFQDEIGENRLILVGGNTLVPFAQILWILGSHRWAAGLALFPYSEHYSGKILTKFFEYLYFNIPVVCSNFPVWEYFVQCNDYGVVVDCDSVDYTNIVSKVELYRLRDVKCEIEDKYSWESQFLKLNNMYKNIFVS